MEHLSTRCDLSVLIQFCYGDDGLEPPCLEGDAQPNEFIHFWSHALVSSSTYLNAF